MRGRERAQRRRQTSASEGRSWWTKRRKRPMSQFFRVESNPEQAILSSCRLMTTAAFNGGTARCNVTFIACKRMSFNLGDNGPRPS